MEPFLRQDDHVLTFNWVGIKAGDVIVFRLSDNFWTKRVKKISGENVFVEGDNKKMSSKIGPLREDQIAGKVIFKY